MNDTEILTDLPKSFPSHYPKNCPPSDASPANILVYRMCSPGMTAENDFLSHYDIDPITHPKCNHRSLSVFTDPEACLRLIARFPRYNGNEVCVGFTHEDSGVIRNSPTTNEPSHHDWWLYQETDPRSCFRIWCKEEGERDGRNDE